MTQLNTLRAGPDDDGHFGIFGGRYVAETLMPLILEVEKTYDSIKEDPSFQKDVENYLKDFVGRPSPLFHACLLYTSPSPRDATLSRMPASG